MCRDWLRAINLSIASLLYDKHDVSNVFFDMKPGFTWDEESNLTGMAKLTSFMVTWAAWEMTKSRRDCRAGLILGHQFFHGEKTSELLESFKEHIGCTVKFSFTGQ